MALPKKKTTARPKTRSSKKIIGANRGVKITLDDTRGRQKLTCETPGGQMITLNDGAAFVEIVDAHGNTFKLDAAGVTITAAGKIKLRASQVEVAAELLKVEAGTTRFNGIVQCDSLIANSVVSASYSPGAGNIW